MAPIVLDIFSSTIWPQGKGTSSQQGDFSTARTSLVKVGQVGLYAHIKEDNVDLKKTLFPKKDIDMDHEFRIISSADFHKGTLKLDILEPIVQVEKKDPLNYKTT